MLSMADVGGNDHNSRWFEINASYLGSRHFNHKYGMTEEYREGPNDEDHFDIKAFQNGTGTHYINPRTGTYNSAKYPIQNPQHTGWDYIIPLLSFPFFGF